MSTTTPQSVLISESIVRPRIHTASAGSIALPMPGQASSTLPLLAKRVIDLVGAIAGLILLAPFMVGIALLVRLSSPGPALFCQRRMGRNGQSFCFYKFRTMYRDAEARLAELESRNESAGGVLFKIRDDPRVTPLGRFLRRTSLDELPQLFNILFGQMSLVGPRPLQLRDDERLRELDPIARAYRLAVTPGLTGAWQVGGRSDEDCIGMVRLDLDYVQNWSFGRDLVILCQTVPAVLSGRGAC